MWKVILLFVHFFTTLYPLLHLCQPNPKFPQSPSVPLKSPNFSQKTPKVPNFFTLVSLSWNSMDSSFPSSILFKLPKLHFLISNWKQVSASPFSWLSFLSFVHALFFLISSKLVLKIVKCCLYWLLMVLLISTSFFDNV